MARARRCSRVSHYTYTYASKLEPRSAPYPNLSPSRMCVPVVSFFFSLSCPYPLPWEPVVQLRNPICRVSRPYASCSRAMMQPVCARVICNPLSLTSHPFTPPPPAPLIVVGFYTDHCQAKAIGPTFLLLVLCCVLTGSLALRPSQG